MAGGFSASYEEDFPPLNHPKIDLQPLMVGSNTIKIPSNISPLAYKPQSLAPPLPRSPSAPSTDRSDIAKAFSGEVQIRPIHHINGQPCVTFQVQDKSLLLSKIKFVIVAKFSHGRPDFRDFQAFLSSMRLKGEYKIYDFDKKHVFVEFLVFEDFVKIWMIKSRLINGSRVRFFQWDDGFSPSMESSIAPIWIHLPALPLFLFDEEAVITIASLFGKLLYIDPRNMEKTRVGYLSFCVARDVRTTGMDGFWIEFVGEGKCVERFWQRVSFGEIPAYCSSCLHLGHQVSECKTRSMRSLSTAEAVATAGPEATVTITVSNKTALNAARVEEECLAAAATEHQMDASESVTASNLLASNHIVAGQNKFAALNIREDVLAKDTEQKVGIGALKETLNLARDSQEAQRQASVSSAYSKSSSSTSSSPQIECYSEPKSRVLVQDDSSEEEGEFIPYPKDRENSIFVKTPGGEGKDVSANQVIAVVTGDFEVANTCMAKGVEKLNDTLAQVHSLQAQPSTPSKNSTPQEETELQTTKTDSEEPLNQITHNRKIEETAGHSTPSGSVATVDKNCAFSVSETDGAPKIPTNLETGLVAGAGKTHGLLNRSAGKTKQVENLEFHQKSVAQPSSTSETPVANKNNMNEAKDLAVLQEFVVGCISATQSPQDKSTATNEKTCLKATKASVRAIDESHDLQAIIQYMAKIRSMYDRNNGTQGLISQRLDIEPWIQKIIPKLNLPHQLAKEENFRFIIDKHTEGMTPEQFNDDLADHLADLISPLIFPSQEEEFLKSPTDSRTDLEEKEVEMDFSDSVEDIVAPKRRGRPPKQKEQLPTTNPPHVPRKKGRPRKFA